jgi:Tol biopolymer transport system component/chitodextrinase
MKKLVVYFFGIVAMLFLFKAGCSDINNATPEIRDGIKSIVPSQGPYGAIITISGNGFGEVQQVLFNGTEASLEAVSDSVILTRVPMNATSGPVEIISADNIFTGPSFTVDSTGNLFLAIDEVRPEKGRIGDTVRISGRGFASIESDSETLTKEDPSQNRAISPRNSEVEFRGEKMSPGAEPLVDDMNSSSGIRMRDKAAEAEVYFNGIAAPIVSINDTLIVTTVPLGATTGLLTVISEPDTASGPEFEILRHLISDISPRSGSIGTEVIINGSDFSETLSDNIVAFNGVEAQVVEASQDRLVTEVPEGATSGEVTVTINNITATGPEFDIVNTGSLVVNISTSGSDIDPDGYLLTINAGDGIRTDLNDTITRSGLREGTYEVLLGDIESNCYLSQDLPNPRTATVEAGATATVEYIISCEGMNEPPIAAFTFSCTNLTCDLDASESTDPDGSIAAYEWILGDGSSATGQLVSHSYETTGTYTVELTVTDNEGATNSVSQDVTVSVPEITNVSPLSGTPGSTVIISGANFSSVASDNNVQFNGVRAELNSASETELSAIVPGDATTGTITVAVNGYTVEGPSFTVEAEQQPKTLEVVISTEGSDLDENGYTLSVTGQDDRFVKPNENVMYSEILENSVQVELTGIAENCAVDGENPRTVNLDNSDNAGFTAFVVSCSAPAPGITGISPTSGPTGSEVVITGSNFSATASENNVQFNGERAELNSASETELLAIVPGTATTGPVSVTVDGNTVEGPVFTVVEPKTLEVTVSTEGPTGDGYTLAVTGQDTRFVEPNGSVSYSNIFENEVSVELSGLGENCVVDGENPRTVNLDNSDNAGFTAFVVSCSAPAPEITGISPTSGTTGSEVVITGSNFSATASENNVQFNGERAELNSASETELLAIVPGTAATGPVSVTVDGNTAEGPVFTVEVLGNLEIITSTSGSSIDSDGYLLNVEGMEEQRVEVNDTLLYNDIDTGSYQVDLSDIAPTCYINQEASNPRTVEVNEESTSTTTFNIVCETPNEPPVAEFIYECVNLSCDFNASGSTDPDGTIESYEWIFGDGTGNTGESVSKNFETSGTYTVELTVTDNEGASDIFSEEITLTVPEITGISPESGPTGSEVIISGTNFRSEPLDNIVEFNGDRAELNSASVNEIRAIVPSTATSGPVSVTIDGYKAEGPTFTVQEPSSLTVSVTTVGTSIDPDGYTLSVTGLEPRSVSTDGSVLYTGIYENEVEVELSDIAANCRVKGGNPVSVNLDNSDNAGTASFEIDCTVDLRGEIIFISDRDGNNEIYSRNENGDSISRITKTPDIFEDNPEISPDGLKIAYNSGGNIFIMDSDGSDVQQITKGATYRSPSWSPKGDKLALEGFSTSEISDIFTVNIDGSLLQNITNTETISEGNPDWSPDGSQLVYISNEFSSTEIILINADGTGIKRLTNSKNNSLDPEWSPDGQRIAFTHLVDSVGLKIHIMNKDGSNVSKLTVGMGSERSPSWSPDGSRMVYSREDDGVSNIYIYSVDVSDIVSSSNTPSDDEDPHWNY